MPVTLPGSLLRRFCHRCFVSLRGGSDLSLAVSHVGKGLDAEQDKPGLGAPHKPLVSLVTSSQVVRTRVAGAVNDTQRLL